MYKIKITNKEIKNTKNLENIIVSGDNLAAEIQFAINKSDYPQLLDYIWYIQYANRYGQGESVLLERTEDDTNIYLLWKPNAVATQVAGRMEIQVYATKDSKKWMTKPFVIFIDDNLNPESIGGFTPTAYQQFLQLIEVESNKAITAANNAATSEANSLDYKNQAEQSASNASNSESNALSYKESAEASASSANNSATLAEQARAAAQANADSIDTSIIENKIAVVDNKVDQEINRSETKDNIQDNNIEIIKNAFSNLTTNSGKIKLDYMPEGAISKMVTVGSQSQMLSLNSEMVQQGDTVRRSDENNKLYYVTSTELLGTMNAFAEYQVGVEWQSILEKPSWVNSINEFNSAVQNLLNANSGLIPDINLQRTIGSEVKKYLNAHIQDIVSTTINNSGTITTNKVISNIIENPDSSEFHQALSNGYFIHMQSALVNVGSNDISLSIKFKEKIIFGIVCSSYDTSLIASLNVSHSNKNTVRIYSNKYEYVSFIAIGK